MAKAGQIDGRTFTFALHAAGDPSRTPEVLHRVVADRPDALIVSGLTATRAARDLTSTLPIVVATSSDLVDAGLARSLAQPGGNVTGVSDLGDQTTVKRLELLKAALPNAKRVVLVTNPNFPATPRIEARVLAAAPGIGVSVTPIHARDRASLRATIESLACSPPDALLVGGDALFSSRAGAHRNRSLTSDPGGALLAADGRALRRHPQPSSRRRRELRTRRVVSRQILKGARPGDLPIHQPVRYELVVNAKGARMFGIALTPSFLLRGDRVVE